MWVDRCLGQRLDVGVLRRIVAYARVGDPNHRAHAFRFGVEFMALK